MPRPFRRAYDQAPEPQFCKAGVWARRIARPVLCECRILARPVRLPDGARRTPPAMRGNCDAARRASGARTWPRQVGAPRGVRHAARPAGERPLAPGAAALARAPDRPAACGIAERPGKRWRAASTRTRFLGRESCMPRKVLADSMRRHAPSGFPQKKNGGRIPAGLTGQNTPLKIFGHARRPAVPSGAMESPNGRTPANYIPNSRTADALGWRPDQGVGRLPMPRCLAACA